MRSRSAPGPGGQSVFSRFTKTNGFRKARSLFLERGRCSPGAREAVRRGAPVLHQLQPTRPPPGSWSGRSKAEAEGADTTTERRALSGTE
jgi:hypothetical protein